MLKWIKITFVLIKTCYLNSYWLSNNSARSIYTYILIYALSNFAITRQSNKNHKLKVLFNLFGYQKEKIWLTTIKSFDALKVWNKL